MDRKEIVKVTINLPNVLRFWLLGWKPPEDTLDVVGHSALAYLDYQDPAFQVFKPAMLWHDAVTKEGKSTLSPLRQDIHFLKACLELSNDNYELEEKACWLFLVIRKFYRTKQWKETK